MTQARFYASADTVWRIVRDLGRLVAIACHSHAQLAVENLFLRKQLAFYLDRKIKPRRLMTPREVRSWRSRGSWIGGDC